MDFSKKRLMVSWALCFSLFGSVALPAQATTTTTTLGIDAVVLAYCAVTAGSTLHFGNYDPTTAGATTGTVVLGLTCNSTSPLPTIGLDGGGNYAGATNRMVNAGHYLTYNLLQSAGGSAWTNAATPGAITITTASTSQNVTVYGSIPSGQVVPAGTYVDTVNVLVSY